MRCADSSSVMSSKVTTRPRVRRRAQAATQQRAAAAAARGLDLALRDAIGPLGAPGRSAARSSGRDRAACGRPRPSSGRASNSSAERLGRLIRPAPSRPTTPAETPASTASVKRRRVVELAVGLDQLAALRLELAGHAVEGARELAELVVGRPLLRPAPTGRRRAPARPPPSARRSARPCARRRRGRATPRPAAAASAIAAKDRRRWRAGCARWPARAARRTGPASSRLTNVVDDAAGRRRGRSPGTAARRRMSCMTK